MKRSLKRSLKRRRGWSSGSARLCLRILALLIGLAALSRWRTFCNKMQRLASQRFAQPAVPLYCHLIAFCRNGFNLTGEFGAWLQITFLAFAHHPCRGGGNDEIKSHQSDADEFHSSWSSYFLLCLSSNDKFGMTKIHGEDIFIQSQINFADHWCWSNYCKTHPGVVRHQPLKLWRNLSFAILEAFIVIKFLVLISQSSATDTSKYFGYACCLPCHVSCISLM